MRTQGHHRVYRACVGLYPASFRRHYGDDLVQSFEDLVAGRGLVRAWLRTALDLLITVPNYRMEQIMTPRHSTTTLVLVTTFLGAAGLATLLAGVVPGLVLLAAAALVGIAQRSALGRAVRQPVEGLRRRRMTMSAALATVFAVCFGSYLALIGDSWTLRETVLSAVGTLALSGAVVFFVIALLTPKATPVAHA